MSVCLSLSVCLSVSGAGEAVVDVRSRVLLRRTDLLANNILVPQVLRSVAQHEVGSTASDDRELKTSPDRRHIALKVLLNKCGATSASMPARIRKSGACVACGDAPAPASRTTEPGISMRHAVQNSFLAASKETSQLLSQGQRLVSAGGSFWRRSACQQD